MYIHVQGGGKWSQGTLAMDTTAGHPGNENPAATKGTSRTQFRFLRNLLVHAILFSISLFISFLLNYNFQIRKEWFLQIFLHWLVVVLAVKLIVFGLMGQMRCWWRYVGVVDLFVITNGAFFSTIILVLGFFSVMNVSFLRAHMDAWQNIPQTVFLLDWGGTVVILAGARLSVRLCYEEVQDVSSEPQIRILIVGAGNTGETLLREIQRTSQIYDVIGMIDENPRLLGARIHQIPILGTIDRIPQIAQKRQVEEIVVALPNSCARKILEIRKLCKTNNLRFRAVPNLVDVLSGRVHLTEIAEKETQEG